MDITLTTPTNRDGFINSTIGICWEFCILLAMGMFDQLKAASDLMKNMSPDELAKLMKQAEESKKMLEDTVRKVLEEEIVKRELVTRKELDERLSA